MNYATRILMLSCLLAFSCNRSADKEHDHNAEAADAIIEESPNIALHEEVMKIHDEVMPKLENIYSKKEALKNKIASNPSMPADQKKQIEASILKLDSASESMMNWMHTYSPLPDSVGEEKARAYL